MHNDASSGTVCTCGPKGRAPPAASPDYAADEDTVVDDGARAQARINREVSADALPALESGMDGNGDEAPAEKDEESEDDLMITLDENATSYEPAPKRLAYSRGPVPGLRPAEASGSVAPGLEGPPGLGAFSGPAAGFGGAPSSQPPRPGIGGLPRSAIPGLGGNLPPVLRPPSSQALVSSDEPPAFPSEAGPTQPIKLPGQVTMVHLKC